MQKLGRRTFGTLLGLTGLGTAVCALPFVRRVRAAPPPFARVERVLIVNFYGGVRSSAAFLASPLERYNPWDVIPGLDVPFSLGRLLDDHIPDGPGGLREQPLSDDHYRLDGSWGSNVQIPRLREMADRFSVVGTWNEARGDHLSSQIEETTGVRGGAPLGILTRIHRALADASDVEIPPFHIRPSTPWFANAQGDAARYAPVSLRGPYDLPSETVVPADLLALTAQGYATETSFPLGREAAHRLVTANRSLANSMAVMQGQSAELGAQLAEPWLNTGNPDDEFRNAVFGECLGRPLSNQMLYDALRRGIATLNEEEIPEERQQDISNIACALRCLQLGSPAVSIELGGFDLHSGEMTQGPPLYHFAGQTWATLHFLLSNIPEPTDPDVSMLDRTLVVTTSEFGRDGGAVAGFNGGEGSDHGTDYSCMYLAHGVMGGGIDEGTLHGAVDTATYNARMADVRYGTQDLLATVLYALGLDPAHEEWGFPEARPILNLWSDL